MRRSFCAKLEADPALMSWVAKNRDEIKAKGGNVTEIMHAYAHRVTIMEARAQIEIRKNFDGLNLPKSIDRLTLWSWVNAQSIPIERYRPYLMLCNHYKLDLLDTKNLKPRHFEARLCELQDRRDAENRAEAAKRAEADRKANAARRREQKREAEAVADAIRRVSEQLAKVEKMRGPFTVYMPDCEGDLRNEARGMGCSCVGSYGNKIARGESVVVFIRQPDQPVKPFVTVDFDPKTREINQCYATDNTKPDQPVLDFVYGPLVAQLRRLHKKAS